MRKLRAVAGKELRQARRDPLSLGLLLGIPTMMLLLYGYAVNFDVRHVALSVEDNDRSRASRELVQAFVQSTYFDLKPERQPGETPEHLFERKRAQAILVIPDDYGRELAAGRPATVQFLVDGTDATVAETILGYANALARDQNARLGARRMMPMAGGADGTTPPPAPTLSVEPRVWYNPELRSSHFLVPGLIGFILMLTAVLSTALSVVREKERGTMEQIRMAPVAALELLVGKTVPYLVISLLATVLILIAAGFLFGVTIRGPLLDLGVAVILYLLGGLGLGLFVSTLARTQAEAFQIGSMFSILPTFLLSGFIFPVKNMPAMMQVVSHIVPARYFLIILRGIILKGTGLGPYHGPLLALATYAVVMITLAGLRFGRRDA
ncbi:MAG TPA: ABC transporter permease [Candidatus Eisenbacteria bacterium]